MFGLDVNIIGPCIHHLHGMDIPHGKGRFAVT